MNIYILRRCQLLLINTVIEKCIQVPSASPCVNFIIDGGEFRQIHRNPIHVRVRLNIDLIKSDSPVGLVSSTVLQASNVLSKLPGAGEGKTKSFTGK